MPRDKPLVYFAMGSSGKPALVAEILQGFRGKPYRVIAPVKSLIEEMHLDIPENVVATDFHGPPNAARFLAEKFGGLESRPSKTPVVEARKPVPCSA